VVQEPPFKVPLLWHLKGSYFCFGSPQQHVYKHARSKTFSLSYNMHLFLSYLLNDSQMIRSTIHFSTDSASRLHDTNLQ